MLVYAKYNGHCAYCGKELAYKDMQVDHIVPLRRRTSQEAIDRFNRNNVQQIKKGTNDLSNLMPACEICNAVKGEMSIEEFREEIKKQAERVMKTFQAKMSEAYGLIEFHDYPINFYFESFLADKD